MELKKDRNITICFNFLIFTADDGYSFHNDTHNCYSSSCFIEQLKSFLQATAIVINLKVRVQTIVIMMP